MVSGWRRDRKDTPVHPAHPVVGGQRGHLALVGRQAPRLRLHAQGLSPLGPHRRAPVRRGPPLHSDLRRPAGRARDRGGRAPPPARCAAAPSTGSAASPTSSSTCYWFSFSGNTARNQCTCSASSACSNMGLSVLSFAHGRLLEVLLLGAQAVRRDAAAASVRHVLPHRQLVDPDGPSRRGHHAHLLRVAAGRDLRRARGLSGRRRGASDACSATCCRADDVRHRRRGRRVGRVARRAARSVPCARRCAPAAPTTPAASPTARPCSPFAACRSSISKAATSRWPRPTAPVWWCSTARSTTSLPCGRAWRRSGTASSPAPTPSASCTPTGSGAPTASPSSTACSPSRCGTRARAASCSRAIASARSRSTTTRTARAWLFASTLTALLQHPALPRALDRDALAEYLALEYVVAPRTHPGRRAQAAGGDPPPASTPPAGRRRRRATGSSASTAPAAGRRPPTTPPPSWRRCCARR